MFGTDGLANISEIETGSGSAVGWRLHPQKSTGRNAKHLLCKLNAKKACVLLNEKAD